MKVSHNPPMSSYHCSGQGWTVWGEVRTSVNFTGPTLSILPEGVLHLHIHATGHQVCEHILFFFMAYENLISQVNISEIPTVCPKKSNLI